MDGNTVLFTLDGDGDGLLCVLQIGSAPYTEGNKLRIQLGSVFHLVFDA